MPRNAAKKLNGLHLRVFNFFLGTNIEDVQSHEREQMKEKHLKERYKSRLKGYIKRIEVFRARKEMERRDTTILKLLIKDLKDKIDHHWDEGSPFNKICRIRTIDGNLENAKKYCDSNGYMECGIFVGNDNQSYGRTEAETEPLFSCRKSCHKFNPYRTGIERSLLRLFILDHM